MDRSNSHRLTGENIDAASESIEKFLTDAAVDRKNVLRFRLMFEEILLSFRDRFGDEKEFTLLCAKRFSRPRVVITIAGDMQGSIISIIGSSYCCTPYMKS